MSELYGKREDLLLEHEEWREKVGKRFGITFEKAKGNASCEDIHRDVCRMKEILEAFAPLRPGPVEEYASAIDKQAAEDPWRILFDAHMRAYWHWQAVAEVALKKPVRDREACRLFTSANSECNHAVRKLADSFESRFGLDDVEVVAPRMFMPFEEDEQERNFMHAVLRELQFRVCEKTGVGHPRFDGCTCKFLGRDRHVCTCGADARKFSVAGFDTVADAVKAEEQAIERTSSER